MHGDRPVKSHPRATTITRWWPWITAGTILLCSTGILILREQGRGVHVISSTSPDEKSTASHPTHSASRVPGRATRPVETVTPAMRNQWIAAILASDHKDPSTEGVTTEIKKLVRFLSREDPAKAATTYAPFYERADFMEALGAEVASVSPSATWEWYCHLPEKERRARAAFLCGVIPRIGKDVEKAWDTVRRDILPPPLEQVDGTWVARSFVDPGGGDQYVSREEHFRAEIISELARMDTARTLRILREGKRLAVELQAFFDSARFPDPATAVREMESFGVTGSMLESLSFSPAMEDPLPVARAILAGNFPESYKQAGTIFVMEQAFQKNHPDTRRIAELISNPAVREEALGLILDENGEVKINKGLRATIIPLDGFSRRHARIPLQEIENDPQPGVRMLGQE